MYYSDDPITTFQEDAFGREVFVNNLANDINHWTGTGSLVMALYGPWGTGKSSVLNLLKKRIETDKLIEIILFDPWYFNSTEQLIQTFFAVVKDKTLACADDDSKTTLTNAFKKYSSSLSQLVTWEPSIELPGGFKIKLGGLNNKKEKLQSPENVREDLRQALGKLKRRFIVIIDNLDRLDSPELMLMFKLVRLCSDFPNFVFVLAFDHEQVRKLIMSQGVDPDFLEKIVQIDIELPLIDQNDIDSFIDESLHHLINSHDLRLYPNSWESFENIYYRAVSNHLINNLRAAKRYLNSVSFTIPIVREEVDFADFLILEVLRVFYPRIYSGLPGYKKELTTFDIAFGSDTMRTRQLETKKGIREWITNEVSDKRKVEVCEQLIGFLFPSIGAYFQNPSNPTIILKEDEYLANQRICVSEFFDKYFRFRVPEGEISTRTINAIEDALNSNDKDHKEEVVAVIMEENERLSQLLYKLYFRVINLNPDARINLISILGKFEENLEWNFPNSINSSGSLAARVIIKCVEQFETNVEIQNAINEVLTTTKSLSLASDITSRLLLDKNHIQIPQSIKDAVKTIMLNKLHMELVVNKQNVFATYPTTYHRILAVWRSEQILNEREIATQYIYEQLYLDANALPKILIGNASFELNQYKVHSFEFDRLKSEYDVDKLYEILTSHDSTANYSPIEQEAIDAFKVFMAKKIQMNEGSIE